MNEIKELTELLSQYDWREAVSAGVGSATGIAHAIYDKLKGNKRARNEGVAGGVAAFSAIFNPYKDGFGRSLGNAFIGGIAYELVYNGTHNLLDKILKNYDKQGN